MKVSTIDRTTHRLINQRIATALKDLGDELGIDFRADGGQYGGASAKFRIEGTVRTVSNGMTGAEADFRSWAPLLGISGDAYGATVMLGRESYKVIGINPNAPKNKIQIERQWDKKTFVCSVASVRHQLPAKAAA